MKRRVVLALGLLALVVACGPAPTKNKARRIGSDGNVGERDPTLLDSSALVESAPGGAPDVVGCADGQREGFADMKAFPDIAGCLGSWVGDMSLRKAPVGQPCGDDTEVECKSPADICAAGWHVCGHSGDPRDLSTRISPRQCIVEAGPGKFVAAFSHVQEKEVCSSPPTDTTRYPCFEEGWGAEPVCCGADCSTGKCKDAIWPGQTRISVGKAQGCGSVSADRNGGILCCKGDNGLSVRPTGLRSISASTG